MRLDFTRPIWYHCTTSFIMWSILDSVLASSQNGVTVCTTLLMTSLLTMIFFVNEQISLLAWPVWCQFVYQPFTPNFRWNDVIIVWRYLRRNMLSSFMCLCLTCVFRCLIMLVTAYMINVKSLRCHAFPGGHQSKMIDLSNQPLS